MKDNFFDNMPRRYHYLLALLIILGVPLGIWRLFFYEDRALPQAFIDSRHQSALVAAEIVSMSNDSAKEIDNIKNLEAQRRYIEALDATNNEIGRVAAMRDKGSALLGELTNMTNVLSQVRPDTSRETALRAINYETSIVNHLISYNYGLDQLLRFIAYRLSYGGDNSSGIRDVIDKINLEIKTIEDLNNQFNAAMDLLEKGEN